MAQTTTAILLLATFLMAATLISGQGPPSPTANKVMNCAAGLDVCVSTISQGGTPSLECCTAFETAVKSQLSCLCGSIRSPKLSAPLNVTAFNALLSHTCGLTTDPNFCSETAEYVWMPNLRPPRADKNAASKLAGTGLVGIVLIMIAAIFYKN